MDFDKRTVCQYALRKLEEDAVFAKFEVENERVKGYLDAVKFHCIDSEEDKDNTIVRKHDDIEKILTDDAFKQERKKAVVLLKEHIESTRKKAKSHSGVMYEKYIKEREEAVSKLREKSLK